MEFLKLLFGIVAICLAVLAGYIGIQEVQRKFGLKEAEEFDVSDIPNAQLDTSKKISDETVDEDIVDDNKDREVDEKEAEKANKGVLLNVPGVEFVFSLFTRLFVNIVILAVVAGFFVFAIIALIKLGVPNEAEQTGMSLFR